MIGPHLGCNQNPLLVVSGCFLKLREASPSPGLRTLPKGIAERHFLIFVKTGCAFATSPGSAYSHIWRSYWIPPTDSIICRFQYLWRVWKQNPTDTKVQLYFLALTLIGVKCNDNLNKIFGSNFLEMCLELSCIADCSLASGFSFIFQHF